MGITRTMKILSSTSIMGLLLAIVGLACLPWAHAQESGSSILEEKTKPVEAPTSNPKPTKGLKLFSLEYFKQEFSKIEITGSKTIGFHLHQVEGNQQLFGEQNYFGEGGRRVTDYTELSINGKKVFGFLNFDWRWANHRFGNPFDARISLSYESKNFQVEVGDITASIGGNQLATFTRTLKGVSLSTSLGQSLKLKYIASETKASARTITIPGNDSAGPYYLQGSQLVDGSERVLVDGVEKKQGEDYTIDYYSGILQFREGMIIPRTSTIVVTYETYAYNANVGRIDGWRLEMPLGSGTKLGFTLLSQTSKGDRGLRTRTERFYGRGSPNVPYDLDFPPLRDPGHPLIVKVDGIPQQEGKDYYFDPLLPYRFYFTRFIPLTSQVEVLYFPRPDPSSFLGGDRKVYALDFTLPLGRYGGLSWSGARSVVEGEAGTLTGTAQRVNLNFNYGRLQLSGSYFHIPPEYVTIESVGFQRNERGYRYDLNYRLAEWATLNWSVNQAQVASFTSGSQQGINSVPVQTTNQTFGVTLNRGKWPALTFLRLINRTESQSSQGRNITDMVRLSKEWGNFSLALDWNRTAAEATTVVQGSDGKPVVRTTPYRITSTRLSAGWHLSEKLSLNGVAALSRIEQADSRTNARDLRFNLEWKPWQTFSLSYAWGDSDSGATQNLPGRHSRQVGTGSDFGFGGFPNGWGAGYNGNGFSSGAPFYSGYTSYGVRSRDQTLRLQWNPFSSLSLGASLVLQRSAGDFQTNSDSRSTELTFTYNPLEWLSLSGQWMKQRLEFLTGGGSSANELFFASLQIGPLHRWTLTLEFQQMNSNSRLGENQGTSGQPNQFAQDLKGLSARVDYKIAPNQSLFLDWRSSQLLGYQAAREFLFGIGYSYDITRYLVLEIGYRIREQRNLDPQFSQYNYRARSLDAELKFRF